MLFSEQILPNLVGGPELLDAFRLFAVSCGWTQDYYQDSTSPQQLQLFSEGYGDQKITLRIQVSNSTSTVDWWRSAGILPGNRMDTFNMETGIWAPGTSDQFRTSIPAIAIPTTYFYGNEKFLAIILHVRPQTVITFCYGSPELFENWRLQSNRNLWCWWITSYFQYSWETLESDLAYWFWPLSRRGSAPTGFYNAVLIDGAGYNHTFFNVNYAVDLSDEPSSSVQNTLNGLKNRITLNSYSEIRMGFKITMWVKDLTQALWMPFAEAPVVLIHGGGLRIGQTLEFGQDVYRVFPIGIAQRMHWQAYRIQ
jgi:hypothetical protein